MLEMDEEPDASASNFVIINHSNTVQRDTSSSTATSQKEKESLAVESVELGHIEPKSDGDFQVEPVSQTVLISPIAPEALLAASIPCPESPLHNKSKECVTNQGGGYSMDREISCTEGLRGVDEDDRVSEEPISPQEPVPNFGADMQGPMTPPQIVFDENIETLANESSKAQDMEDAQSGGNISNDGYSSSELLKLREYVTRLKSCAQSIVKSDEPESSKSWSPNDPSIVDEEQTANIYNKCQTNDGSHAEANAAGLAVFQLPSTIPPILGTGTENPFNAESEIEKSINIEYSRVAIEYFRGHRPFLLRSSPISGNRPWRPELLSVGTLDGRSLNIETVGESATAFHFQESVCRGGQHSPIRSLFVEGHVRSRSTPWALGGSAWSCSTPDLKIQIFEAQDVIDSAVAPQGPQAISNDGVESQIVEPPRLTYPAAAPLDIESCATITADLKPHAVELHDLADVAAVPRVAVDNISSSNEKYEKDSKADPSVELTSRAQELPLSEEIGKPGLGTISNGKAEDTSGNLAGSTVSKDGTTTPKLTGKRLHYQKFIAKKKAQHYARKMATEQAAQPALDLSNRTPGLRNLQASTGASATAKDNDTSSNRGHVPSHIRASSDEFTNRARKFQEVNRILPKKADVAQSDQIGPVVSEDWDNTSLDGGRHDGFDEVAGVKKWAKAPDDRINVSRQSNMVRASRGANGRSGRVKRMNDVVAPDRNSREGRGETLREDHHTHTSTPVKSHIRAGIDGHGGESSGPAADLSLKGDRRQRSVSPMSERSAADVGSVVVVVPKKRKRWQVKRVVAGMDQRKSGPKEGYANTNAKLSVSVSVSTPHPPESESSTTSIARHQTRSLKVHDDDGDGMNDLKDLHDFTAFPTPDPHHRRHPRHPDVNIDKNNTMILSGDGLGRTARGPRGTNTATIRLPSVPEIYISTAELTTHAGRHHAHGRAVPSHHHHPLSIHHPLVTEFKVETMNTTRRQHPGFQPQPLHREADPHRLYGGIISNRRVHFQSNATATSLDKGAGTMTNHPDSIANSNPPAAASVGATMMAMTNLTPGRPRPDGDHHDHDHNAQWSLNNDVTEVAPTNTNTHITTQDQVDSGTISHHHTINHNHNHTDNGHDEHNTDTGIGIGTGNGTGTATATATGNQSANVSTPHDHHHQHDRHGGMPPPTNTNHMNNTTINNTNHNHTNHTNRTHHTNASVNGRYQDAGSGSGSVRTMSKSTSKARRVATSSAPLVQEPPSIVPDGTWDASTTPTKLKTSDSSNLDLRINLVNLPKWKWSKQQLQNPSLANSPSPKNGSYPTASPRTIATNPRHGSDPPAIAGKATRASNAQTTAIHSSPPAQHALARDVPALNAPTPHAPAEYAPAQHGSVQSAPAKSASAQSTPAQPVPAQHAPVQSALAQSAPAQSLSAQVPAQPVPAQQAPAQHVFTQHKSAQQAPAAMTEAPVVHSASPDRPDQVQRPKSSPKGNGVWLAPHMRPAIPVVPIQPSRKVMRSANPKSAEANRNARAKINGNSLEANASAGANANGSSAKANPLQTSVTASIPVNADVSTAKDKPAEPKPCALSNADVATGKNKPAEPKPSALSNADVATGKDKPMEPKPSALSHGDVSTAKDKPTEASPTTLLKANGHGATYEPVESNPSAAMDGHVSDGKVELAEPNSSGLLLPDVSNILPPISKGKQPDLVAPNSSPTPQGSISNVSVNNSQTSIAERRAPKKETLDFEHPLAGWDGGWGPAPVEWCGRPSFDHSDSHHVKSLHNWLLERARDALHNPLVLNTQELGFMNGQALAAGDIKLGSPIDSKCHDTILPDDEFTKVKVGDTAADAVKKHRSKIRVEKQETKAEKRLFRQAIREAQASYSLIPNPHAPVANIYIRPAESKDMKQISEIYNHYIDHSVVVAELQPLTEQQWRGRWQDATESNYAFLVAVQLSAKGGGYNRRVSHETVCGFAYADDFGDVHNAWRYTCELQCYVGNWTLRLGVGKSLIDRMLDALDPVYSVRAGARFEGGSDPIRYEGGGVRVVHKVVINIPYASKEEDALKWRKEWLAQFKFEHVGTLMGIGRKFDKVVNLAMLMMETGSVLPGGRF